LLGDEAADGPNRSLPRPGIPFPPGQGAFYLGEKLTEVPGQQLQQYNRSPQEFPTSLEQNANIVELKIPYTALGVHPGQTIQVSVVATTGVTNAPPELNSMPIDITGGIAGALSQENGKTIIEPIEVELATGSFELQVEKMEAAQILVSWFSVPGKKYRLQWTSDLAKSFENVPGIPMPIAAQDYELSFPIAADSNAVFLRALEVP
jgi:hypothetical protein